jgi:hypothetical protein
MPDTASTDGLLRILRTHLLNFVPSGTDTRTLLERLGTYTAGGVEVPRFWFEAAPDDVSESDDGVNLWALMQIIPAKASGDDGGYMRRGDLEVQLFGRPRRSASDLSQMADIVEQALFRFINHVPEGGYIKPFQGLTRSKIEYESPADRELYQINLRVRISYIPEFLSQYST